MLLQLVNFDPRMVKWCTLHTLNLGVAQWVAASVFYELLKSEAVLKAQTTLAPKPKAL